MLLGGDEMGRTQQGNNNAYCQDNEISWFDWEHADRGLLEFTRRLIAPAARAPGLPPPRAGSRAGRCTAAGVSDIAWFRPDGAEMSERGLAATASPSRSPCSSTATGSATSTRTASRFIDDSFLLLFNAHHDALEFTVPPESFGGAWQTVIDTTRELGESEATATAGSTVTVPGRALLVLIQK